MGAERGGGGGVCVWAARPAGGVGLACIKPHKCSYTYFNLDIINVGATTADSYAAGSVLRELNQASTDKRVMPQC
jgi:hypothetical protein